MKTFKWREKIPSAGVVIGEKMKEKRLGIADLNGVPERVHYSYNAFPVTPDKNSVEKEWNQIMNYEQHRESQDPLQSVA